MEIDMRITERPRKKPNYGSEPVSFGKMFTDHMLLCNYENGEWGNARIVPYGEIMMSPAANSLHYGMSIFEGMKAYKSGDQALLFRPFENARRFNESARRMCMPEISEELFVQLIAKLVELDKDWIPEVEGMSLYLRPFMFATDPMINVTLPESFMFSVLMSPADLLSGGKPMRIKVEEEYVRAAPGGTGAAKTSGNYAAAMRAVANAKAEGFDQVLWLDAIERKYVEEVSAMNVFFVIGKSVVTPSLSGTILEGITRASIIEILRDAGVDVQERKISVEELVEAHKAGELREAFGTGTAAVIAPIGHISWAGNAMDIAVGETSKRVYTELTQIQTGRQQDTRGWTYKV